MGWALSVDPFQRKRSAIGGGIDSPQSEDRVASSQAADVARQVEWESCDVLSPGSLHSHAVCWLRVQVRRGLTAAIDSGSEAKEECWRGTSSTTELPPSNPC